MKLYELPRGSLFTIDECYLLRNSNNPPVYVLDHIDGMYSVCYDKDNTVVHFSASTPVIPLVK